MKVRSRVPSRGGLRAAALLLGAAGLGGGWFGDEAVPPGGRAAVDSPQAPGDLATLAGIWSGSARVGVSWCRQTLVPLSLAIAPDGSVTGRVGDATLVGGRLSSNRGPLLRKLGWFSDWQVSADLAGDLVAAEGLRREVARIPFDVVDGHLRGSVTTDGTVFGGKDRMTFSAAFDDLSRTPA